jgi:flagellar hook assembly protein FlgD
LVYDTGVNTGNIKETNELNLNLKQNYPNPFNPSTNIEYDLSEAGEIKVEIFNVIGELISTIVNEYQRPGKYTVKWDGTDDSGGKAASGVYFYRVTSNEKLQTRKMILLR